MKKFSLRPLMIVALALGVSLPVLADTIRLKDGSVIRGQIVSFKNEQFTIIVGGGARGRKSRVTVYMEDVESIEFDSTGGLIAVIGDDNDDFIFVGRSRDFVAQRDGVLFLGVNEGNLSDNSGLFEVTIEAETMGGNPR